jgi:hypothetical protein
MGIYELYPDCPHDNIFIKKFMLAGHVTPTPVENMLCSLKPILSVSPLSTFVNSCHLAAGEF